MANDFSAQSDVVAVYNCESGALGTDSKNGNNLTLTGPPSEDTTNYKQGSCAWSNAAAQYGKITDASLSSGWPLKSGDTTKTMMISMWLRPTTVDANQRVFISKTKNSNGMRSWQLYHTSAGMYFSYSSNGTAYQTAIQVAGAMAANAWYHIIFIVDGVNKTWLLKGFSYNSNTSWYNSGTLAGEIYAGTAAFIIGANEDVGTNLQFVGQIDEVVISNSASYNHWHGDVIRCGVFPTSFTSWKVDPTNGVDTNLGFTWATAKKTLAFCMYPGELALVAKNVETQQSGTGVFTNGSRSVTGISGWTPAANNVIRPQGDNMLYLVSSYSSGTITMALPYRGTSGTKNINLLTNPTLGNNLDLNMQGRCAGGTETNRIEIRCGINTSNDQQDGYTIWHKNGYNGFQMPNYVTMSNFGMWGNNAGVTWVYSQWAYADLTNVFTFYFQYQCWRTSITQSKMTNVVSQGAAVQAALYGTEVHGWICAGGFEPYGGNFVKIWDLELIPSGSGYLMQMEDVRNHDWEFINAKIDVLNLATSLFSVYTANGSWDVKFTNPTIGSTVAGALVPASGGWKGKITFNNINNTGDSRTYFGDNTTVGYLGRDASVYNTAAPSAKFTQVCSWATPMISRHWIPLKDGVEKTLSVYLRKNSTYGSVTRPKMRITLMAGSPAAVTVYEQMMSDTNDTFVQVSQAVTPAGDQAVLMEIIHQSKTAGAASWYDDIGVN